MGRIVGAKLLTIPWTARGRWVQTALGQFKAQTPEQANEIIRAVNIHDRLVATLATIHETAGHVSDAVNALALIKLLTIGPLFDEARGDK